MVDPMQVQCVCQSVSSASMLPRRVEASKGWPGDGSKDGCNLARLARGALWEGDRVQVGRQQSIVVDGAAGDGSVKLKNRPGSVCLER